MREPLSKLAKVFAKNTVDFQELSSAIYEYESIAYEASGIDMEKMEHRDDLNFNN